MANPKTYQDRNQLPEWLPSKIAATGFTVEQVGNRTGVSRSAMYEYLTGKSRPTSQTALKLSRVLGVAFEEILKQYTPAKRGRPFGSQSTAELKVRK